MNRIFRMLSACLIGLSVAASPASFAEEKMQETATSPMTLTTATPEEGFALAIQLSRRTVTTIQPDKKVLHAQRPVYAGDAEDLIAASQVVAVHFQTIAQANGYWRD